MHDWFNSVNYAETGLFEDTGGVAFNTAFDVYSFTGMAPAWAVTMVGGLSTVLGGGRFEQGFLAAGFTEAFSPAIAIAGDAGGSFAEYGVASLTGGFGAELAGGRFEDGAVTGVFAHMFSNAGRARQQGNGGDGFVNGMLDVAGKIWALPNTIIGLTIGGIGYCAAWAGYAVGLLDVAPSITIGNNAIQFENIPWGTGALTLGNTIIYGGGTDPNQTGNLYGDPRYLNVGRHEMGHTYQYQAYGPFFLPAYFIRGGISETNPFEQGANNYAAGGSWLP